MGAAEIHFSHIGILTTDLEKSVSFYRDALDFEAGHESSTQDTTAISALCGIEGSIASRRQFMTRKDGLILELRYWTSPQTYGSTTARPMNEYGNEPHLLPRRRRGQDRRQDRGVWRHGADRDTYHLVDYDLLFCTDPSGVRIELMKGVRELLAGDDAAP